MSYTRAYLDIFDGIVSEMVKKWTQNDKDCVKFVAGCVNYEKMCIITMGRFRKRKIIKKREDEYEQNR